MIELRPYQVENLDLIWGELFVKNNNSSLCVLPTGTGKSVIISSFVNKTLSHNKDLKIIILFNKIVLLDDLSKKFKNAIGKENIGIYCSGVGEKVTGQSVTIASIQSVNKQDVVYDVIIIDEAHNVDHISGRYHSFLTYQKEKNKELRVLGFTATPFRRNGYIYGKERFFNKPVEAKDLLWFIENNYLVRPVSQQPLQNARFNLKTLKKTAGEFSADSIEKQAEGNLTKTQVRDALLRMTGRKKIVWFCSTIKHSENVNKELFDLGEKTVCIHSALDFETRNNLISEFRYKDARHLVFVTIFSEGFDEPQVDTVVFLRPTRSPTLMVQTCGRGLRPFEGKENCLILDYADVFATLGPLTDPIILNNKKEVIKKSEKICPKCQTYLKMKARNCDFCGYEYPTLPEPKNTHRVPDENITILSSNLGAQRVRIEKIDVSGHISSSGNKCIKISYFHKRNSIHYEKIDEFFVYSLPFSRRNFEIRAAQLGISLENSYEQQVRQTSLKQNITIEYEKDGAFKKIKRVML